MGEGNQVVDKIRSFLKIEKDDEVTLHYPSVLNDKL